jgi:hypothetical protein
MHRVFLMQDQRLLRLPQMRLEMRVSWYLLHTTQKVPDAYCPAVTSTMYI